MERHDAERLCYENQTSPLGDAVQSLVSLYLTEAREKNDDTDAPEFHRYQGEIRAYKRILKAFTKYRALKVD